MLRKRSSSNSQVRSSLMADSFSIQSPTEKYKKPTSFPKLFTGFPTLKSLSETFDNVVMSPTSILDTKPFPGLKNPFWPDQRTPKNPEAENSKRHWDKLDSKTISHGLVDALIDDKTDPTLSKPESNRMVLFGSQLKIQIPPLHPISLAESPESPSDFGTRTRNSPSPVKSSGLVSSNLETPNSSRVFTGCLSVSEMELSEDYTCVISHVGPNPTTTHIFDNCIVESFCFSPSRDGTKTGFFVNESSYPSESFLSSCFACKKKLGQGKDIYMYRGEKAFCSNECRYQEMMLEESLYKLDSD